MWEFKCNLLLDKELRKLLLKNAHKKQEVERLYYREKKRKDKNKMETAFDGNCFILGSWSSPG